MDKLFQQKNMIRGFLDSVNKKLLTEPGDIRLILLRGILYNIEELYDEAISDLDYVIKEIPENGNAYYLRSDCYLKTNDYDKAKQDYLRALKIEFKDDKEFTSGYTEKVISESTMSDQDEADKIKKVLEYEKVRILLSYISQLEDTA